MRPQLSSTLSILISACSADIRMDISAQMYDSDVTNTTPKLRLLLTGLLLKCYGSTSKNRTTKSRNNTVTML
jgi:hypothetical protein